MMIRQALVEKLRNTQPGNVVKLPVAYVVETEVRKLLACTGHRWDLIEDLNAGGKVRWSVRRVGNE
jgi:hypothetical protein